MKISITADVHLRTREDYPERYNALEDIFKTTQAKDIDQLIIAGDLFDEDFQNYSEFERICKDFSDVTVHVIPGNHDPSLESSRFIEKNVRVYSEPQIVDLGCPFLFMPFSHKTTMGQAIASFDDPLEANNWVLVGHGDYYGGTAKANPYEPGTYMPLHRSDVESFRPKTVLLGHIHLPTQEQPIYYPGSPCGLDISETGRRSFLVYDTEYHEITSYNVKTDVLFFQESFVTVPRQDEVERIEADIHKRIESWDLSTDELEKVRLRVRARGYCLDRRAVGEVLNSRFKRYEFYKIDGPDVSDLESCSDDGLRLLTEEVEKLVPDESLIDGAMELVPSRDEIIHQALHVIYNKGK